MGRSHHAQEPETAARVAMECARIGAPPLDGGIDMNRDQIKGRGREAAGKVQQEAGKLMGSPKQRAKGLAKQGVGKVQKALGDAREEVKRADRESARRARDDS